MYNLMENQILLLWFITVNIVFEFIQTENIFKTKNNILKLS